MFDPVPFKLLKVVIKNGCEYVADIEYGSYSGLLFDPWKRGDPVVVCYSHSAQCRDDGRQTWDTWHVGKRASVPSAAALKILLADNWKVTIGRPVDISAILFRIPYRWRPAAEKLFGQEFATREALEQAMENQNAAPQA